MSDKMRIDKWLWMVRVFKTRTVANEACNAGKVKIDGVNCKASREIKKNVEIQIRIGQLLKTIQVVDFPKNRLPAKLVSDYYIDLTPQEEYDRIRFLRSQAVVREHGLGRPTKRDRRQLEYLKDFLSNTDDWEDE
ncbi:MAG TPA: RNA-binding S4 domain-containing protein [Bacteroidales bacterium]|nr:RNA-binding S4 domain-containing protein [Bacteroidales bacterium]HQB20530.1 RNA-binding S4 domain-containing protein [Bacteroidales bacterium]